MPESFKRKRLILITLLTLAIWVALFLHVITTRTGMYLCLALCVADQIAERVAKWIVYGGMNAKN